MVQLYRPNNANKAKPIICDALRDLVQFVQFEKREKHPCKSVTFSKVAGWPATLLKVALLHGCFSRFLNCTNDTKSRNASHMFVLHPKNIQIWNYR